MAENGRRKGDTALLLALAGGCTLREAARQAGIGERTATRRVSDPGYRHQVAQLRAELIERAAGKMADAMVEAADTLRQLLGAEAESVRLGAARSILELGSRLREHVELEAELRVLKDQLTEGGQAWAAHDCAANLHN